MENILHEEGNRLVAKGLLISDLPKSPVRLGFPIDVVDLNYIQLGRKLSCLPQYLEQPLLAILERKRLNHFV